MRDEVLDEVAPRLLLITTLSLGLCELACVPPTQRQPAPTIPIDPAPVAHATGSFAPSPSSSAPKPRPGPAPVWETSEPEARATARREGMPMIVYLRADWAVASIRMERDVWTDPRVALEGLRFVMLKMDLSSDEGGDAELYADRYEAPSVPAIIVVDAHGERVALLAGEVDAQALLEAMRKATE